MRRRIFAEVTEECINVFFKTKDGWKAECFNFPYIDSGHQTHISGGLISDIRKKYARSSIIIVANTRYLSIRAVDIPTPKLVDKIRPADRWALVEKAYPIGEKMNENTYIFDGTVFTNEGGDSCFFMIALPCEASENMAKNCSLLLGANLKCLDSIEHYIFKHFAKGDNTLVVVFPQGNGLRVLYIEKGLPKDAWYISNDPMFREDELLLICAGLGVREAEITTTQAIILNNNHELDWVYDFFIHHGTANEIKVELKDFVVTDYLG